MSEQAGDGFVKYLVENRCSVCGRYLEHKPWCSNQNLVRTMKAYDIEANIVGLKQIAIQCNRTATEHGFWEGNPPKSEKMMLEVSEIAERLEAVRMETEENSEKIPHYTKEEEEWADLIIRALDYAVQFGIRPEVILAKMRYNDSRPFKHGKKF